ncbi:MAG TPA: pyruvate kinase [Dissulfurispiraceae bacterium]|nr:pyruvate kinase [Dissulfurispiraceae bacterium]
MRLPANKTKIVCTIGPASESQDILQHMIRAGMNIARLNFSHGDYDSHSRIAERIRNAASKEGRRVALMADLPGPKMRIGRIADDPVELRPGDTIFLTTEDITGSVSRVSVTFERLPLVVKPRDTLYLNDGLIQLEVINVSGNNVKCEVVVGGELRSRKGLNLPGIDLGISAFTETDRQWLGIAKRLELDAVSQSFVDSAADIDAVRAAAHAMDYDPFIIAKIERRTALKNIDPIISAADGIMIARGDLGVEIPIEDIALVQKSLMKKANLAGKPVITATQMLESMTGNPRPTRAESTDVANAILDGTDCVMLSGESAMGMYPIAAVNMLARIAASIERMRSSHSARDILHALPNSECPKLSDIVAMSVESTLKYITPAAIFVPTHGGGTARSISRFRLPVWIVAVSAQESTCQSLQFSYGVRAVHEPNHPDNWNKYIREWLSTHEIEGTLALFTEGPSSKFPDMNNKIEIVDLKRDGCGKM